jgi:hypothetical protein
MAVVPVEVAYDVDLRGVFNTLKRAGERLRAENPDVMDDTEIGGITAFGASAMTVRTSRAAETSRQPSGCDRT